MIETYILGLANTVIGGAIIYAMWWLRDANKAIKNHETRISVMEGAMDRLKELSDHIVDELDALEEKVGDTRETVTRIETCVIFIKDKLDLGGRHG